MQDKYNIVIFLSPVCVSLLMFYVTHHKCTMVLSLKVQCVLLFKYYVSNYQRFVSHYLNESRNGFFKV